MEKEIFLANIKREFNDAVQELRLNGFPSTVKVVLILN